MTKLIPRNNSIPEYLLGGFINNIGLHLLNSGISLFRDKQEANKYLNKDPRYDPKVENLQKLLYKIGAFGNISKERAIDGISGRMTNNAINKAKSMGYTILNNKLIKPNQQLSLLDRIRNAWNNRNKPTLEEFKEKKRQELRDLAARVNSQTITPNFPQLNGAPQKNHDMDVFGKKGWSIEKTRKEFTKYAQLTRKYLLEHPNIEPLAKKRILETLNYYDKVIKDPNYINKKGGGFGCIYTASGAYGDTYRWANNKELADAILSGKDTGFEIVEPNNYKVGDIILLGRSEKNNYPHHALMVTDMFFGYPKLAQTLAEGYGPKDKETSGISAWNNDLYFNVRRAFDKHGGFLVVRFVGTKKQNLEWEKEYHKLYG